jgi:hypothetical protein
MDDVERVIDDVLNAQPLVPLPYGFKQRLMGQIANQKPGFRLEFLDIAIPGFIAGFCEFIFLSLVWLYLALDPSWLRLLQLEWELIRLKVGVVPNLEILASGGLVLGWVVLSLILASIAWLIQPGVKAPGWVNSR